MLSVAVLKSALLGARQARDKVAETALKRAIARVESAEAPPSANLVGGPTEIARLELTENDIRACLQAELDEASDAVVAYRKGGRHEAADRLELESAVLERYLTD